MENFDFVTKLNLHSPLMDCFQVFFLYKKNCMMNSKEISYSTTSHTGSFSLFSKKTSTRKHRRVCVIMRLECEMTSLIYKRSFEVLRWEVHILIKNFVYYKLQAHQKYCSKGSIPQQFSRIPLQNKCLKKRIYLFRANFSCLQILKTSDQILSSLRDIGTLLS